MSEVDYECGCYYCASRDDLKLVDGKTICRGCRGEE